MKSILIETIPHEDQRYPTVGDYLEHPEVQLVTVSELGDWRYEFLVALHELVEMALTKHRGISERAITEFDIAFERTRATGNEDEPGDDPQSPYRLEHRFAENIERQMALALDVDWKTYDQKVSSL